MWCRLYSRSHELIELTPIVDYRVCAARLRGAALQSRGLTNRSLRSPILHRQSGFDSVRRGSDPDERLAGGVAAHEAGKRFGSMLEPVHDRLAVADSAFAQPRAHLP